MAKPLNGAMSRPFFIVVQASFIMALIINGVLTFIAFAHNPQCEFANMGTGGVDQFKTALNPALLIGALTILLALARIGGFLLRSKPNASTTTKPVSPVLHFAAPIAWGFGYGAIVIFAAWTSLGGNCPLLGPTPGEIDLAYAGRAFLVASLLGSGIAGAAQACLLVFSAALRSDSRGSNPSRN